MPSYTLDTSIPELIASTEALALISCGNASPLSCILYGDVFAFITPEFPAFHLTVFHLFCA